MTFGKNIQKDSRIDSACFSFHVALLFSTFRLSNRTAKITRILTLFSKEDEILIKNLYKCKGYNTRHSVVYNRQVG